MLGSLLLLAGFVLPWLRFGSVVSAGSPSVAGYEMAGFVRTSAWLLGLSGASSLNPAMGKLVAAVPLLALLASLGALLALRAGRVGRAVGLLHAVAGGVSLLAMLYVLWAVSRLGAGGAAVALQFVGLGLWLTLAGTVLILLGGLTELIGR
jgi:hypothetical protein